MNEKSPNTFYYLDSNSEIKFSPNSEINYPHISVNIGSGVSVLKVSSKSHIERMTGSLMGGATLIGLSKLLTGVDNYNLIMNLAEAGDNSLIDLIVRDIHSDDKTLPNYKDNDIIASSFGKIINPNKKHKKEDICKSLLLMVCYHIAQLAFLVSEDIKIYE